MAKEIKFDIEARDLLKRGVDQLSDAVKAVSYTHLDVYKRQPHSDLQVSRGDPWERRSNSEFVA